jgi:plastocyanin
MKNIIFFVILALLTVVALVSFSTAKNRLSFLKPPTKAVVTPTTTPTPDTGSAPGRSGFLVSTPTVTPASVPSSLGITTKGGLPLTTPTPMPVGKGLGSATDVSDRPTIWKEEAGFRPVPFTIKQGTMMVFKNNTNRQMQIIGDADARNLDSTFSQKWSVGKNGFFEFAFSTPGTYHFYDQQNQNMTGSVIVTN